MKETRNYAFVDQIRAVAMIAIVFEHCSWLGPMNEAAPLTATVYELFIQLSKYGTVCFFLLAGFLIGDKFLDYTPAQYLKRRVAKVAGPWFLWTLVFLATLLLDDLMRQLRFGSDRLTAHFFTTMADHLSLVYFFSNYWFIINFLVCIGILMLVRKHLYAWWPGMLFLLCTVFYSINIYYEWVIPYHSTAFFGFVFFLWLGAQLYKHWDRVKARVNGVPLVFYATWMAISVVFCIADIKYLKEIGSVDPYNSLRFSNILFSFAVFFFLVRLRNLNVADKIDPRNTTFGIFLIHYIIVYSVLPQISKPMGIRAEDLSLPALIGYQLIRFIVVYLSTILFVKLINKSRVKWLVGK